MYSLCKISKKKWEIRLKCNKRYGGPLCLMV